MIFIHKNFSLPRTKPIKCPICEYGRAFDVPINTCVRASKRGFGVKDDENDVAFLKCKKCRNQIGITIEN